MTKFEQKTSSDRFTALAETEDICKAGEVQQQQQQQQQQRKQSAADNCRAECGRSESSSKCTHCLCAAPSVVETMKASLHRFVRICPSCCAADRFRIRLIPDCAGFVAQNGFVAQAKCFRLHNGYHQDPFVCRQATR